MRLLILSFVIFQVAAGQTNENRIKFNNSLKAGLGITSSNIKDVVDYLNSKNTSQKFEEFSSLPEFFISYNYKLTDIYLIGAEYLYSIKYNSLQNSNDGTDQIDFDLKGIIFKIGKEENNSNYNLQYGLNIGYVDGSLLEHNRFYGSKRKYTTNGILISSEMAANLNFDENLSSHIGLIIRYIATKNLEDEKGSFLKYNSTNVTLNNFGFGIRFGLNYNL